MKEHVLAFEEAKAEPAPRMQAAQPFRLADGGLIDRDRSLSFRFDRKVHQGHPGDTLASALLASGVRLVGRSFKYHRPRGVLSAGSEEPSALVQLGEGARTEPNTRATMVELYDGLVAFSQNRWPTLAFDLMAANGLLAPIFPAGFYYKTFMWPASFWEPLYERLIRRAAGLGKGPRALDPDRYEKRHAHCDVLVVGAGPAGLAAALAAGRAGARVVLADENPILGGRLLSERFQIDDRPALDWAREVGGELESLPEVTLLPRTTAVGYYDDNLLVLVEQAAALTTELWTPRQRLWTVRAREIVLATGAIERPLVFPGNDRPGVMLAGAVRTYLNRFAVAPGRRAVVLAGCDDAWRTALGLAAAGVEVAAIVDPRENAEGPLAVAARGAGMEVMPGHVIGRTFGRLELSAVEVAPLAGGKAARRIDCDLCAVSGGWQPALHLHSQTGVRPVWDADLRAFRPGEPRQRERSAGAAAGHMALAACLESGFRAGAEAAEAAGFSATPPPVPAYSADEVGPIAEIWSVPAGRSRDKAFVDLQDDVTEGDVALAHREGYRSVEHLKRYTTLGMGTDQGKTANLAGLALLAGLRGDEIATVGTTTFRPPFVPVSLGVIAGREIGAHFKPVRRTPMHAWHEAAGAKWIDAGLWMRARYYPKPGEDLLAASLREARAVRERVGLVDVSTLGKIEVQGPDAAELLGRPTATTSSACPSAKRATG
jgi:sarcosine oxidase subunit alpha